ncbi:hypothetical protein Tco_0050374 [Tanacetum coccineum]
MIMDVNWTSKDMKKVDHAVATTSVQYCFEKTDPDSVVLACSFYEGLIFPFSNTILFRCVGIGNFLRNPFFIIEVDEDDIPEFSTIVSSELFDFDVILIFNSFDEGHDSFRCFTFLLQEVYPGVP